MLTWILLVIIVLLMALVVYMAETGQSPRDLWNEVVSAWMLAAEYDAALMREDECKVPPAGWYCTREAGHSGPCAAVVPKPGEPLHIGMDFNVGKMAAIIHVIRNGRPYAVPAKPLPKGEA